ncbi:toxin CfTX-A-like [Argopecten irradians]|uniref:toxin CfTX-A-like n=1 Tax=Argopecten irradians TaxID=31199 RepID=UPI00371812C2
MSSVCGISEILTKIGEFLQQFKVNVKEQIEAAKKYFQTNEGSLDVKKIEDVLSRLKIIYDSLAKFTSGDSARLLQGVLEIVSSVSSFTGLGGAAVPAICGVLSKVFSAFGGHKLTIGEVVEGEIRRTFAGHSNETLFEEAEDLHLLYRFAYDFLNPAHEKSHFSEHDITNMNIQMNVFQGATFLRKLGKLIKELAKEHEEENSDKKIEKARKAMQFIELYVKLASLRDMILFQFYTITNSTPHSLNLAGGVQRVLGSFEEQDREALGMFLRPLKEYVYLVSYAQEEERPLLMMFLDQKKLLPDHSWLTHGMFSLYSVKWPECHAIRLTRHRSFFGNGDLRYLRSNSEAVGPESWFYFIRVKRKRNYFRIIPVASSDECVCMTKGQSRWVMCLRDGPKPQTEWKVIQMDNGNYVFSSLEFPDYFMGVTKLLDGSVAGFNGGCSRQTHWTIRSSE